MNLNGNQVLSIILIVLSVLVASTAQLTDLVGPTETKVIVSIASLLSAVLNGVMAVITGQSGQRGAVSTQSHTIVVQAQSGADTTKMAATIATMPEVAQIIASPRVANATASDKIVANADAKVITP